MSALREAYSLLDQIGDCADTSGFTREWSSVMALKAIALAILAVAERPIVMPIEDDDK